MCELYTHLEKAFGLKGSIIDHKFVIRNKEIDIGWPKKEFINFIELNKCSINNPVRIFDVKKGTKRSYMKILADLPAPSKLGEPNEWFKQQKNEPIYLNHRLSTASSITPVSLYCLIFGCFQDFCEEVPEFEDNLFTYTFCIEMAKFYESKEERQVISNKMLSRYFNCNVQLIQLNNNCRTDGTISYSGLNAYRMLNIEYNKEQCSSSTYPHLESCGYYLVFCKEQENNPSIHVTNFPCFLVIIAGPFFSVFGTVLLDKAVVDSLTPVIPLL
ncbi:5487_t:CDS:2 [Funneliformis geosporum]|nr:5487_t:CDS:2 [Funneliformis geosporum]